MTEVTADQIKDYREKTGVGLLEAKRVLQKEARRRELQAICDGLDSLQPTGDRTILRRLTWILMEMNQ